GRNRVSRVYSPVVGSTLSVTSSTMPSSPVTGVHRPWFAGLNGFQYDTVDFVIPRRLVSSLGRRSMSSRRFPNGSVTYTRAEPASGSSSLTTTPAARRRAPTGRRALPRNPGCALFARPHPPSTPAWAPPPPLSAPTPPPL